MTNHNLKCPNCPSTPTVTKRLGCSVPGREWYYYRVTCRCGLGEPEPYEDDSKGWFVHEYNAVKSWQLDHFPDENEDEFKEWS
jgi:hypothetical protein